MVPSPDYRLRLLGGASIEGPEGPLTGRAAQRNALALMATLATASDRTLPRESITALLWPERESKPARHLLNVTAYEIRKALGEDALVTANGGLHLSRAVVGSDAEAFDGAVEAEDWRRAAEIYTGAFLDGFHFDGSEPFERWVERERWRYERLYRTVLERLAERAEKPAEAAERWRALLERDPASATATLGLMHALEAKGRRAEAIDVAHAHRTLLLDEYGADPNPDVETLADRLREAPKSNHVQHEPNGDPAGEAPGRRDRSPAASPSRSWRLPAGIAATVVLAFLAILLPRAGDGDATAERTIRKVLVAPLANETGDSTLARLGLLAADFISQELRSTGLVAVLSPAATRRDYGTEGDDVEMATASGADILVSGEFYRQGDSLAFQTRIVDPSTGEIVRAVRTVHGSAAEPTAGVDLLRRLVTGALTTTVDPRLTEWTAAASQPPSFEAYQVFADGLDQFFREEWETSAESFRRAAAMDSSFTAPLIWAMYAYGNRGRTARRDSIAQRLAGMRDELNPWDRAQLDAQLAETIPAQYDAIGRLVQVSPDSEWLYRRAQVTSRVGRFREALEILESMDPERGWLRQWPYYWRVRASARHLLGEHEEELEDARRAIAQFPDLRWMRILEYRSLAALDRPEEILQGLEAPIGPGEGSLRVSTTRALYAHGHLDAAERSRRNTLAWIDSQTPEFQRDTQLRFWRGQLLVLNEQWEEALPFFEGIIGDDSWTGEEILHVYIAICAVGMGDEERARRELTWIRAREIPRYEAAILAHLEEFEEALRILEGTLGVETAYGMSFHQDPIFRPLWNHPRFVKLLGPRG